jgi:AraC family transcriptional regulator of arabinose operon
MDPRVQNAVALMTADLRCEIPFGEIACSMNLSPSRLQHLFTSEIGSSPLCYLKAHRLQKAKELLETTFLNMKQIMLQVGIKDKSHFIRDFKKAYSLSPTQHRTRHLRANLSRPTERRSERTARLATK